MNPTWKAAIGVILIFILGWFGGVLSTWIFVHHKTIAAAKGGSVAMAAMLDRQMTRGLKLDADQKAKVYAIFLENLKKRTQLQNTIQPQVWTINQQTMQAIKGMLTAGQQEKFQDNLLRFEANFGRDPLKTGPDKSATDLAPQTASTNTNTSLAAPPPQ